MDWHERLQQEVTAKGWTTAEFSRRVNMPYERVVKYLAGDVARPRGDTLERLANVFGMTEQELLFGDSRPAQELQPVPLSGVVSLQQVIVVNHSSLLRIEPDQDVPDLWDRESVVAVPGSIGANCFAMHAPDESNLPDISQGDLVLFDPDAPAEPGMMGLFHIKASQAVIIRRYAEIAADADGTPTEVRLSSINPDFPALNLTDDDEYRLLGRAVFHLRAL